KLLLLMPELLADCLYEIFKYLRNDDKDDRKSLNTCIFVSRLWCKNAIPLFWACPWYDGENFVYKPAIIKTILSCLSDESRQILIYNDIATSYLSSYRQPLFNYVSYCQNLSPWIIDGMIHVILSDDQSQLNDLTLGYQATILEHELYKLYMSKVSSITRLVLPDFPILYMPGARLCLSHLSDLDCSTDDSPRYFFCLAEFCRKIQRLRVYPCEEDNQGLATLITLQHRLIHLELKTDNGEMVETLSHIGDALTTQAHSLTYINVYNNLFFSTEHLSSFIFLKVLKLYVTSEIPRKFWFCNMVLPHLEILDVFRDEFTPFRIYMCFIDHSSSNFRRIYWNRLLAAPPDDKEIQDFIRIISRSAHSLNFVTIWYSDDFIDDFTQLLSLCTNLVGIKICAKDLIEDGTNSIMINAENILKVIIDKAPKNFSILNFDGNWSFSFYDIESFFYNWKYRNLSISGRPLSLFISDDCEFSWGSSVDDLINKYVNENVLKCFRITEFLDLEDKEFIDVIDF
ncbi:16114_t:CDS:1, partial [Cetraspora pellucida]